MIRSLGFWGLVALLAVPAWAGAPGWVSDLEQDFPNAKYLAAVGVGDTRKDAEAAAAGALAKRFTVHIQADTASQKRYLDLVKGDKSYSESESKFSQSVDLQANESLMNVRFSDPYADPSGTVSVVAYLERSPTGALYRNVIGKDVAKAASLEDRAKAANGTLLKFALLDSALVVEQNAARLLEQLRIIHPVSADSLESEVDLPGLAKARDEAAAKLTYALDVTGDERIGSVIQSALSTLSLAANPGGPLHLKGVWTVVPVKINPQYQSVQWTLELNLVDEAGSSVATISKTDKENGLTMEAARGFALRQAGKFINATLASAVTDYLTRLVTGQ